VDKLTKICGKLKKYYKTITKKLKKIAKKA